MATHSGFFYLRKAVSTRVMSWSTLKRGDKIILDTQEAQNARVREIVENSFKDFETGNVLTEDDMVRIFGKYGWHK